MHFHGLKYPCHLYNLHSVDSYVKTKNNFKKSRLTENGRHVFFFAFFSTCQHLHSNGLKYPRRLYNLHSVDSYVKPKEKKTITMTENGRHVRFFSAFQHLHSNGLKYLRHLYNLHSVDNYVKPKIIQKATIDRE